MRFIPWRVLAAFVLGLAIGAATLNLISGTHLDTAQLEIERLNVKLDEQSKQIATLQETIAQHQEFAVTEIQVAVSFKDAAQNDEINALEIEKTIKDLLKSVRGREVSTIDPVLLVNIVDGRTIEVSNVDFKVKVKILLISEKLLMHVEAEEKPKPVSAEVPPGTDNKKPNKQ